MSKQLIYKLTKKDFVVQTFRAGGKGGQKQNKTDSGVRISHPDSGAVEEARDTRSQLQNKKLAFHRLLDSPKFKLWHAKKVFEFDRVISLEQQINDSLKPQFLKLEIKNSNDQWQQIPFSQLDISQILNEST